MSEFDLDILRASLQREQRENRDAVAKQRRSEKSRNHWRAQAEELQIQLLAASAEIKELKKNTMPSMSQVISGITDAQIIEELKKRLSKKKK